jgi:hypothetical protein
MKASGQVQATAALTLPPQISQRYSLRIWLGGFGLDNLKHRKISYPHRELNHTFSVAQPVA